MKDIALLLEPEIRVSEFPPCMTLLLDMKNAHLAGRVWMKARGNHPVQILLLTVLLGTGIILF